MCESKSFPEERDAMDGANPWWEQLERDGVVTLSDLFTDEAVTEITRVLETALANPSGEEAIRGQEGTVYAARNLLQICPEVGGFWRRSALAGHLERVLGSRFGLVRVLFFDKPPGQTWVLPWHKDLTIAVRNNRLPSSRYGKPTRKAGVPHVEAPVEVLQTMLTARIHLDEVTEENGPLKVAPGSHHSGKRLNLDIATPRVLHAGRGDVLLMRPLVAHCSGKSHPDTTRHRRVLHLEFAASEQLPDGYEWHAFVSGRKEALAG
jgi:Phytanoyl-CoA dioxygenase (PhyH)